MIHAGLPLNSLLLQGETSMNGLNNAKAWVAALTDLGLTLLALAIVVGLLVGAGNLSFFGNVTANIIALVKDLGSSGLAGLITLGVVLWLFSNRNPS